MTQEEKQLLLKDLCARVPYNTRIDGGVEGYIILDVIWYGIIAANIEMGLEPYLPYLRPMSSMTEEEKDYIKYRWCYDDWTDIHDFLNNYKIDAVDAHYFTDWLNSHHFDYRGLIEKGLALEAPENMYE